jgi:hypothetical protein
MLRTNFSASGRDLYDNADLNNLVILPFITQNLGKIPYGVIYISMNFRFAGRINPDAPQMSIPMRQLVAKDERKRERPQTAPAKNLSEDEDQIQSAEPQQISEQQL